MNTILSRLKNGQFTLIAEVGVNYYDIAKEMGIGNMEAAKLMVLEAKNAGIHAVKFQTYKAETLAAKESPFYWDITEEPTRSQYELFKKFDAFGEAEYRELYQYCEEIGIEFLSTPFDIQSADYLCDMMNIYKISSSDLSNLPFITYIAQKGKPIILSIGASELEEIERAVETIRRYNSRELILMHCVLEYPTPLDHANLNKIVSLRQQFPDVYVGYSDHTKPTEQMEIIQTAYTLGATVVEKHFTLNKTLKGNDHYHAMDPSDAKRILQAIEHLDAIRGSYELRCLDSEQTARKNARRSLVALTDIPQGAAITREMLTFKRPNSGISPSDIERVIGQKAAQTIAADTVLQWDMLSGHGPHSA